MNYDKIISATHSWFSLNKLAWFLIFFWLSVSMLFLVPWALEKQYFDESVSWIIYIFYALIYLGVLLGFITLNCACLGNKRLKYTEPTKRSLVSLLILVFVELVHVFIWNLHRSYRFTQLLLLLGIPLLYFYYLFNSTQMILVSLAIFLVLYLVMVIYNIVRLFFTVTIFYNKNDSIKEVIRESWGLTHGKFVITFFSIVLVVGVVFVMFAIMAIILGGIANVILLPHFTPVVAYELAKTIAIIFALGPAILSYYFGVIEVYAQLDKEKESSSRIKRILTKKVLSPKKKSVRKVKKATKKKTKKKSSKKKSTKKK